MPRFFTLADWLAWQETLHPSEIDLGLERVREVLGRLGLASPPFRVITVGGTNGKGSTVAYLEAILCAAGYRVGAYTSPHLLRYNERIRIDGAELSDAELCTAFAAVDAARGDTSITYFEFGTLAAIERFARAGIEVAVLEVGLGGRLDAVNILDADAAAVTSVAIDHEAWLGSEREAIGYEKAGIFRAGRPAVCGDPEPPESLLRHAREISADLRCQGRDFVPQAAGEGWHWRGRELRWEGLPLPGMGGGYQLRNAATALAVLEALRESLPVGREALERGLREARVAGRFQRIPGPVELLLDVAHNPHAAAALAETLAASPCAGRTLAVVGMLGDKDVEGVGRLLAPVVDAWFPAALHGPRALDGTTLRARLGLPAGTVVHPDVAAALAAARAAVRPGDRIVVFGSFFTVAEAMNAGL